MVDKLFNFLDRNSNKIFDIFFGHYKDDEGNFYREVYKYEYVDFMDAIVEDVETLKEYTKQLYIEELYVIFIIRFSNIGISDDFNITELHDFCGDMIRAEIV